MTTKKKATKTSSSSSEEAPKEQKFEENLDRLEKIVEQLEGGEMDLDKSLNLFEEGVKLSRACMKKLDEAQTKVELLLKDPDGQVRRESLEVGGMSEGGSE